MVIGCGFVYVVGFPITLARVSGKIWQPRFGKGVLVQRLAGRNETDKTPNDTAIV